MSTVCGHTQQELADQVKASHAIGEVIESVDLNPLQRIVQHVPEDMTVRVEAGISFVRLLHSLAVHRQWIPVDPWLSEGLSIEEVLSSDLSGPRRYGYGPVRDHIIGMQVVLGDGRLVKSGGQVVKNVAGYDLMKLFIGARRSLGIIVEASFKLLPLPEQEVIFSAAAGNVEELSDLLERIHSSPITPVILDVHHLNALEVPTLVVGFAGNREDVTWQTEELHRTGRFERSDLSYAAGFWSASHAQGVTRVSVRPSELIQAIQQHPQRRYVARAGNGVIYFEGASSNRIPTDAAALALSKRIKETFDPRGIFPPLPS